MLCWFLCYTFCITMWICCKYTYIPSLLSLPCTPLDHHRPLGWAPMLHSRLPLASYFTHGSVRTSVLLSWFISPSPSPVGSTSPSSTSVSQFLPCRWVHQYHFSVFHIYALVYDICFSLWLAAAAAKSLQSCPTLCDPIDSSPPGSSVPGILQARTLEWVAISFSTLWLTSLYNRF